MKNRLKLGTVLPATLVGFLVTPVLAQDAPLYVPAEGYYPPATSYAPDPYATYDGGQGAGYDPAPYPYQGQAPAYDPAQYGYQSQTPAYDSTQYGYQSQTPAYDPGAYAGQGQASDYTGAGYGAGMQPGYGYTQPGYDPAFTQPGYAPDPYAVAPYAMDQGGYYPGFNQQPGYGYAPPTMYPGYGSASPLDRFSGNGPWSNWDAPDIFGNRSPFQDPLQHEGLWAKKGFRPWRSGPFAYDKWENHPATQMPWGNFPGWGKGFFGGYGPDSWEGATPWGNDVPFKWFDPTDPEESIAEIWEDALNAPSKVGRLPPGWTAPYISVPNPIDVENEFERNAMNAPDEIHKMWGGDGAGFGSDSSDTEKSDDADKEAGTAEKSDKAGRAAEGGQAEVPSRNRPSSVAEPRR